MNTNLAMTPEANTLTLPSGVSYAVRQPTPGEMLFVAERMRDAANKRCPDPIELAGRYAAKLNPAAATLLMAEALKAGLSGSRASVDAVYEEYDTLEGVRWRFWFHVLRPLGHDDPGTADSIVTADNRLDVNLLLSAALRFEALDPKDQPPPTGTTG